MEKHAMALGYFFLAVFCLFASGHPSVPFQLPLLLAGLAAALVGTVFFVSACALRIKNGFVEVVRLIHLARELPPHRSAFQEDHPA